MSIEKVQKEILDDTRILEKYPNLKRILVKEECKESKLFQKDLHKEKIESVEGSQSRVSKLLESHIARIYMEFDLKSEEYIFSRAKRYPSDYKTSLDFLELVAATYEAAKGRSFLAYAFMKFEGKCRSVMSKEAQIKLTNQTSTRFVEVETTDFSEMEIDILKEYFANKTELRSIVEKYGVSTEYILSLVKRSKLDFREDTELYDNRGINNTDSYEDVFQSFLLKRDPSIFTIKDFLRYINDDSEKSRKKFSRYLEIQLNEGKIEELKEKKGNAKLYQIVDKNKHDEQAGDYHDIALIEQMKAFLHKYSPYDLEYRNTKLQKVFW